MKTIVYILIILFISATEIFAQTIVTDTDKSYWTIYLVEAYRLGEDSKWSVPGIEIQYSLRISSRLNMQTSGGYNNWGQSDTRAIPLLIGVSGPLMNLSSFSINPYLISGPSLLIGNDYAGIFATAETGIEFLHHSKGISLFMGYGQNMLFHSDHSNYIKGGIGYTF